MRPLILRCLVLGLAASQAAAEARPQPATEAATEPATGGIAVTEALIGAGELKIAGKPRGAEKSSSTASTPRPPTRRARSRSGSLITPPPAW